MDEMLAPNDVIKTEEVKIDLGNVGKIDTPESVRPLLVDLHCKFFEGSLIHSTLATRLRNDKEDKLFNGTLRGLARWHCVEADEDYDCLIALEKIAIDYHDIDLVVCKEDIKYLETFKKDDITLELLMSRWSAWEKMVLKCIASVLKELTGGKLYEFLCEKYKMVENELLYIKILHRKFKLLGYDEFENITWIDRKLHKYFEHDYKKHCRIDFNI